MSDLILYLMVGDCVMVRDLSWRGMDVGFKGKRVLCLRDVDGSWSGDLVEVCRAFSGARLEDLTFYSRRPGELLRSMVPGYVFRDHMTFAYRFMLEWMERSLADFLVDTVGEEHD